MCVVSPHDDPVGEGPEGIAVDPDTSGILVANQDDGQLSVLDPETFDSRPALLGETPIRVVVAPDGRHAPVPNRESNDVSVIDAATFDGIDRVDAGVHPDGIDFVPE